MEDWKERLKAEYTQTKERYKKLKAYNIRQEVAHHIEPHTPICSGADAKNREIRSFREDLMLRQQSVMCEYLKVLELRAELEGIEL